MVHRPAPAVTSEPPGRPRALADILDLERIEEDIFRGGSPRGRWQRVFGGQVAGQALVAAGRTVAPDRAVHSLHAYFIRPGDPEVPIVYTVDRTRDGRSFTTRRVTAIQHGRAIFTLSASFHRHEQGLEHQDAMPEAPAPEVLPAWPERRGPAAEPEPGAGAGPDSPPPRPVDIRPAGVSGEPGEPRRMVWMRTRDVLPDDPLLHVCAVAYASDMTLLDSVTLGHELSWEDGRVSAASLDHAMWFHWPFRADEWLLYVQRSPAASGARGLAQGTIFRRDGLLVASVVQEGLIRLPPPPAAPA